MDPPKIENEHGAPASNYLPIPEREVNAENFIACLDSWLPAHLTMTQRYGIIAMHRLVMTAPIANGARMVTRGSLKRDIFLQGFVHPVSGVLLPASELVSRLHTHADLASGTIAANVAHWEMYMSEDEWHWFVVPGSRNPWVFPDWSEVLHPFEDSVSMPTHFDSALMFVDTLDPHSHIPVGVDPDLMYVDTLDSHPNDQSGLGHIINPQTLILASNNALSIPIVHQVPDGMSLDGTPPNPTHFLQTQPPQPTPSQQTEYSLTSVAHTPAASNTAFEPNFSLDFDLQAFDWDPRFNDVQREAIKVIHRFIRDAPRENGRPRFTRRDLARADLFVRSGRNRRDRIIAQRRMNLSTLTQLVRTPHASHNFMIDSDFSADDLHLTPTQFLWLARPGRPGDLWPPSSMPGPPNQTPASYAASEHHGTPAVGPTSPAGPAAPEVDRLPEIDLTQRRALSQPGLRYLHRPSFRGPAPDNRPRVEIPEVPYIVRRIHSELLLRAPRPVPVTTSPLADANDDIIDQIIREQPEFIHIARRQFGVDLSVSMQLPANGPSNAASGPSVQQPLARAPSQLSQATLEACMIDPVTMAFPTPLPMQSDAMDEAA